MKNQKRKSKPASLLAVIVCIVLLAVFRLIGGSDGENGTESTSVVVQHAETVDIAENLEESDSLQEESYAASQLQQTEQSADSQSAAQIDTDIETQVKTEASLDAESLTSNYSETAKEYHFRSNKLLNSHYEKHGIEMGFDSAKEYEAAASNVANNPDALHKTESEDGDDIYYLEDSNEFVVISTDGYIRTYFNPDSGIKYYNKQ